MKLKLFLFTLIVVMACCTKKIGIDPDHAYSDLALFDSTQNKNYYYYKNKPDTLLSGAHGPHGTFKLRFNSTAYQALDATGKLPVNATFPDGSFLVKDVYKNGTIDIYAYIYKRNGNWLWGEAHSDGKFTYTAKDGPAVCLPCHSQSGNRNNTLTFNFY